MRPPLFPGAETKQGQVRDAAAPSVPASPYVSGGQRLCPGLSPQHTGLHLSCSCLSVMKKSASQGVVLTSSHHGLTPAPTITCHHQPPPAVTELQVLLQPQPRGREHQCHLSQQRAQSRILLPPAGPPAAGDPARGSSALDMQCLVWGLADTRPPSPRIKGSFPPWLAVEKSLGANWELRTWLGHVCWVWAGCLIRGWWGTQDWPHRHPSVTSQKCLSPCHHGVLGRAYVLSRQALASSVHCHISRSVASSLTQFPAAAQSWAA